MNICLLNDSFPPVIDGVVNVMMNYANYLMRDDGASVIVGTPRYPDADYSAYPYPVVAYPSIDTSATTNGYRTGYPFAEKAVSALADFHPDIIHSHCPATATIIARLLREQCGAPIVFTYHTKYDIDIRRAVKIDTIAEEGIKAMVSNIAACDDIWVVSRGAGESLKELGFEGDYLVMSNGVDFARGRVDADTVARVTEGYDLPEGVPVFLFVGRLINYKNLPLLLDAMKTLSDEGRDFRMVFIGKGPDGDSLREKAHEMGLMGCEGRKDKCIFVGPIYDREALRAWNTRADLFLFPSTFDTNGLVVREAAACGLASVLIEDSCAAEGITDGRNGFLIEETAESMAAFLRKAGWNLDHLHEVGQRAMDEIYLSWQACVATAYDRYQFVLEEKAAGRLPNRKKEPIDYLLAATARSMHSAAQLRAFRDEWVHDFRDGVNGMMDNIEAFEDKTEQTLAAIGDKAEQTLAAIGDRTEQRIAAHEEISSARREEREALLTEWQDIREERAETKRRAREERAAAKRSDRESLREEWKELREDKMERFWAEAGEHLKEQMEMLKKSLEE